MKRYLKTAQILDRIGCYKLADNLFKMAISQLDFDLRDIYKKPETIADQILHEAIKTKSNPMDVIYDTQKETKETDPIKAIQDLAEPSRMFHSIYPQVVLFPEDNVWKFFFTDPLSLKALENIKYLQLDPETFTTYDILFTTNLQTKDYTPQQAVRKLIDVFPDASIDYIDFDEPVDLRDQFEEEKYIEL